MLNVFLDTIRGYDVHHWVLIALVFVLLATLFFFYKGLMKSQQLLERNESEIKELKVRLKSAQAVNEKLQILVGDKND